ncbi:MAG: CARDB domain-containing protein [Cyanobacteria bacterium P01_F01_bin.143]
MDLNTTAFQVLQNSAHADDNVSVLFNIENVTDDLIEGVGVSFYLSRNGWISTGDHQIGSYSIESIASNVQSGVLQVELKLPSASDKFWLDDSNSTYFIGALIDNNDAIDLGSSAAYQQFVTHDAIDITELTSPDFIGEHFSVSNFDRQADGSIVADIDFSIFNQGNGASDGFTVDFYISDETDNSQHPISTDDYFIGSYEVGGLANGNGTGILSTSLNVPSVFDGFWDGSGYYSLGMIINPNGESHESRADNNSNQGEGLDYSINTIFHDFWVDLHGVEFNVRQEDVATYQPGQNVTIDYAIRNGGLGYVGQDFNLNFYISTDADVNTGDTFIGSQRFTDDLAAGAYGRGVADFILPDNLPALTEGRYYVGFVIDPDQEVFENNEVNNNGTRELFDYDGTGGALDARHNGAADLSNSYFNVASGGNTPGATVDVEFSAANLSHVAADPFSVGIYISSNEYISTNDFLIGTYDVTTGLASYSDTGILSHSVTLPDENSEFWKTKGNGTYFIGMVTDPTNAHGEFTELNNSNLGYKLDSDTTSITGLTFTDLIGSSFAASAADGDSKLLPGELVSIDYQIGNQEERAAGAFEVAFYFSSNDYISENDVLIGTHQIDGLDGLDTTDFLNGTFELPDASHEIWSQLDGTYYFGMIIDGAQQVVELSHLNNQNQGQHLDSDTVEVIGTNITGDDPSLADLIGVDLSIIDGISENNVVEPGAEIDVKYSVLNAGGNYAPFFANEFFIVERDLLHTIDNLSVADVNYDTIQNLFGDEGSAFIQLEPYEFTGEQDVTLRIPENISAGHYAVVMQTDVFDEVFEANEFNNIIYADVSIEGPDLYNGHLSLEEHFTEENPLIPGETFTAEYEIVNGGTHDIPFFAAHFYLVTEDFKNSNSDIEFSDIEYNPNINSPDFDPDSDPLFTDVFPLYGDEFSEFITLGAGHSTDRQSINLEIPEDYNIAPGKYYLGLQSDVFDEVDEPNELNNSLLSPTIDFVEIYVGEEV